MTSFVAAYLNFGLRQARVHRDTLGLPILRPLKDLVDKAAKSSNVPAHFVRAVIREESGFRPSIESFANAVGLIVLVPTGDKCPSK